MKKLYCSLMVLFLLLGAFALLPSDSSAELCESQLCVYRQVVPGLPGALYPVGENFYYKSMVTYGVLVRKYLTAFGGLIETSDPSPIHVGYLNVGQQYMFQSFQQSAGEHDGWTFYVGFDWTDDAIHNTSVDVGPVPRH